MLLKLRVDPALSTPIWSQIEEGVRRLVASGRLGPGQPLPSVRDLARELRVNPNTAAKAYQRLVGVGVVETRRGEGTFVATNPPVMSAAERASLLRDGAERYSALAVTLGVSAAEATAVLREAWPATAPEAKGGRR